MAVNAEAQKLIKMIGQTPGFQIQHTGDQSYKVVRLPIPRAGLDKTATVKVSGRAHDQQLENVSTRLRRIGWTQELYEACEEATRQARMNGQDPAPYCEKLLLEALGYDPQAPAQPQPERKPVVRRHSKGGTATGSAKTTAGLAVPAQTSPAAPVQVIPDAEVIRAEIITPERALELLVNLAPYQRPLRPKKVTEWAGAMRRGEWVLLRSDPICIDINGKTANGQHRLQAVVECELPQPFYIAYGTPVTDYRHMDRGAKRTSSDTLYGANEVSTHALAAVTRLAFLWFNYEQDQWRSVPSVSEPQILATLEQHPGLRDSVRLGRLGGGMSASPSAAMLVHYLISRKMNGDTELVTRWYQAMSAMSLSPGSPGHTLGLYLLKSSPRSNRRTSLEGRPRRDLDMYLLMQAWNNTCLGKEVRNISWKSDFEIPKPIEPTARHTFPPAP